MIAVGTEAQKSLNSLLVFRTRKLSDGSQFLKVWPNALGADVSKKLEFLKTKVAFFRLGCEICLANSIENALQLRCSSNVLENTMVSSN